MSFMDKMNWAAREVSKNGPRVSNWIVAHHWLRAVLQNVIFAAVIHTLPSRGDTAREILWRSFVRFTAWTYLLESLGFRAGPIWGRFAPGPLGVFANAYYRLSPGTLKFSIWSRRFVRRSICDIIGHIVLFVVVGALAISPCAHTYIRVVAAIVSNSVFLFDHQQWVAGHGPTYGFVIAAGCFPVSSGALACVQLHTMLVWIGCGLGKVGPWFKFVNGPFMSASVCLRGRLWFWRFAVNGDNDLRPTRIMGTVSSLAAHIEWGAPLLLLSAAPALVYPSIFIMVAMHSYINFAPAVYDVYAWNLWFMLATPLMFGGECALSMGFDVGGSLVAPRCLLGWVFLEGAYIWYGLMRPQDTPYNANHRHWAGNWPNGLVLIRKTAAEKMLEPWPIPGRPQWSPPPAWTQSFLARMGAAVEDYEVRMFKTLGHFWNVSMNMKCMPALVQHALCQQPIGDFYILHILQFADLFMGGPNWNHRVPEMIEAAVAESQIREGDCVCIWTGPFPFRFGSHHGRHPWKIIDGKVGVINEGNISIEAAWAISALPSDSVRIDRMLHE